MLINLDLKQIEVCIFAHLCKDTLLLRLLNEGKDLHRFIAANVYNTTEDHTTDEMRTAAKTSTFGIIYGNGPKTLSERTGRDFDWCKDFIDRFYELFPKSKIWHNDILNAVNSTGQLKLFTGQILTFIKYPAKYAWQLKKGIKESYNPPDIKNHPVQHLAFIIMSIILAEFFRKKVVYKRDKYLLINTVHDSLMLDCRNEYLDEAIQDLVEIVDSVPSIVYNRWSECLEVPIVADITVGHRWSDL